MSEAVSHERRAALLSWVSGGVITRQLVYFLARYLEGGA